MLCLYPEGDGEGLLEIFFTFLLNSGGECGDVFCNAQRLQSISQVLLCTFLLFYVFSTIIIISIIVIIIITTIYWLTNG